MIDTPLRKDSKKGLGRHEASPHSLNETLPILRSYAETDRSHVMRLLHELPLAYPGGREWLTRRLRDVEKGLASCTVAALDDAILGIAIETPKGNHLIKLSTLYVREDFRKKGLGTVIMAFLIQRWRKSGVAKVTGTYDSTVMPSLGYFMRIHGFKEVARVKDRYWAGHTEAVVEWTP